MTPLAARVREDDEVRKEGRSSGEGEERKEQGNMERLKLMGFLNDA